MPVAGKITSQLIPLILSGILELSLITDICNARFSHSHDEYSFTRPHHTSLEDWTYHQPPSYWKKIFPDCNGVSQSPVNIVTKDTKYQEYTDLVYEGHSKEQINLTLRNNGKTVELLFNTLMTVSGGPLNTKYQLHSIHFHWGGNRFVGSEHRVDGFQHSMEVHLILYSIKYKDKEEAEKYEGIKAIAFFVMASLVVKNNEGIEPLVNELKMISFKDTSYQIKSWKLKSFVPINESCYFVYQGSYTMPPCNETVLWTIYKNPVYISLRQMEEFRRRLYEGKAGDPRILMGNNYRPVQPISDRVIYRTCDKPASNTSKVIFNVMLILISILSRLL